MKILVRLPNWLGDVVMSTAFITAVQTLYPGASVDVIIKSGLHGIASFIPGLHTVHQFSKQQYPGLTGVFRFGKALRAEQYDIFFNLPSSLSSAIMARATGAKKRVGYAREGSIFLLTDALKKPVNIHRVDEYLSLLEQFTGKAYMVREVALNVIPALPVNRSRVLINFNSEAPSRRMPADKGVAIVNRLTRTFPGVTFSLIGSPTEAVLIGQMMSGINDTSCVENLAGKTTLEELIKLMASSAAVLTTDSGPAHLANSVGTPTIALFGAGNELNTAPYNKQALTALRYGKLSCEPCVKNTCRLYGIPKCMQLLDELQIIDVLSLYLTHA